MLEGNVPTRLLQTKLTSNIASFTSIMKDEIDRAISDMDEKYNGKQQPRYVSQVSNYRLTHNRLGGGSHLPHARLPHQQNL